MHITIDHTKRFLIYSCSIPTETISVSSPNKRIKIMNTSIDRQCYEHDSKETMSMSSPNKRTENTNTSIDRLSALPDCLLIHILSFLGVYGALVTSVLSKRWQFLWAELPNLHFSASRWGGFYAGDEKLPKFVALIHRTLATRSAKHLESFDLNFNYDKSLVSDVDAWLEFAVRSKVKSLSLGLGLDREMYTLPEVLYSSSSLTCLSLGKCIMAPLKTIEWQSLTKLYISRVKLDEVVVEKIISGCPVLRKLSLTGCRFSRLKVDSPSIYELRVELYGRGHEALLEISAPYLQCLDISFPPLGRKLVLQNISSLVRAKFNCFGYDWDAPMVMNNTVEIVEKTSHVKELDLGLECFQVVSMLAVSGWQLPLSRRVSLRLTTFRDYKHNISGIVSLLESSPDLETLVIWGRSHFDEVDSGDSGAMDSRDSGAMVDLDNDLMHLKRVKMYSFASPSLGGDPMLTIAKILLKRATLLEEMIILSYFDDEEEDDDEEDESESERESDETDLGPELGPQILAYPRSSHKAEVKFQFY